MRGEADSLRPCEPHIAPHQGLLAPSLLVLGFGASLGLTVWGSASHGTAPGRQRASSHSALNSAVTQGSRAAWKTEGVMSLNFGDSSEMD